MLRSLFRKTILTRILIGLWISLTSLSALEAPPQGLDITDGKPLKAMIPPANGLVKDLEGGGKSIAVTMPDPKKFYLAQFQVSCPGAEMVVGDRVLAILKVRVTDVDVGMLSVKLQLSEAPYTAMAAPVELELHRDWMEFPALFVAKEGIPQGKASLVMLCGQKAQTVEIASVRVLKYPEATPLTSFPRIRRTYDGRSPEAPWRKAALERIERDRKADFSVTLTGADGKPLSNREVKLTLRRHEFGFGTATPVKMLLDESEDGKRWREIVDRYFSIVVFENDLKDMSWGPDTKPERRAELNAEMDKAFAWLAERHIPVRGHYLMQVPIPSNLREMKDMELIRNHFIFATKQRMEFVKDRVCEWDVINHPIAWNGADMLNARPGYNELDREIFQLARSLTKLPMLVNEDQIFRPGPQFEETYNYIESLNKAGLNVAGLGNQAHFHESYLPSPEQLLAVTDRYAKIVPKQIVTEFDIVTLDDEELAADYTRDALIACFSHPAYSGFLWWGFWEGNHWKPEAASWSKDWTMRKRGEVITEWLGKRWRTEVSLKTNEQGTATWRGFPGWYAVDAGSTMVNVTKAQPKAVLKLAP